MSQNFESVDGRRREPPEGGAFIEDWFPKCEGILERPGDFLWLTNRAGDVTDILIWLPGNEGGSIAPVPVALGAPVQGGAWGWDGNYDKPTLVPSIWRNKPHAPGDVTRNEWHGNLNGGRFESPPPHLA